MDESSDSDAGAAGSDSTVVDDGEDVERTMTELLSLFGKAHTLAILRVFAITDEPWRFTELEERLAISPNTLSDRLKELTASGLLARRSYNEIPPRVEYVATEEAAALFPVYDHLRTWAEHHDLATAEG